MTPLRGVAGASIRLATATLRAVTIVLAASACGSAPQGPTRLVDGSRAPPLPAALAGIAGRAVVSRVRTLPASGLDAGGRACIASFRPEFGVSPGALVVERAGAIGASLTFLDKRQRVGLGCDRTARPGDAGKRWCARSVGRIFAGRLRDPRVDILCRDARGHHVGFGWVQPAAGTRWIVVRNGSDLEVEKVAANLPVRVATFDVDAATSSATFAVTEYDARGGVVRSYQLRTAVAG